MRVEFIRKRRSAQEDKRIPWDRLLETAAVSVMLLILLLAYPVEYIGLAHAQPGGGAIESVQLIRGRRAGSLDKIVLYVDGDRYRIAEGCVDGELRNLEAILQRRVGETVSLRYTQDLLRRRSVVELKYMDVELVNYAAAMASLEPAVKESAMVSAVAVLAYILMLLFVSGRIRIHWK